MGAEKYCHSQNIHKILKYLQFPCYLKIELRENVVGWWHLLLMVRWFVIGPVLATEKRYVVYVYIQ